MRDEADRPLSVRYEEVDAMLLNEFLKEHGKVEAQAKEIAELKTRLGKPQQTLEALATEMQKVSARLEASEARPLLVAVGE